MIAEKQIAMSKLLQEKSALQRKLSAALAAEDTAKAAAAKWRQQLEESAHALSVCECEAERLRDEVESMRGGGGGGWQQEFPYSSGTSSQPSSSSSSSSADADKDRTIAMLMQEKAQMQRKVGGDIPQHIL